MTISIRRLCASLVISVAISATGAAAFAQDKLPGAGKTVNPARATWDTFWFAGYVIQTGLEQLGYKVNEWKALSAPPIFQGIAQGEVDFTMDTVMPFAKSAVDKVMDDVVMVGPVLKPGSVQGYIVDKATAEKHNIRYIRDLLKPEIAKVFSDGNADGKARMIGPNAGWGSEGAVLADFKKLGLGKTVELVQGEYNVLVADAVTRQRTGKPTLFFAWYPNTGSILVRPGIEGVWLNFDEADAPGMSTPGDIGCAVKVDPCNTGSAPSEYWITMNKKWAATNPAAAKFLSQFRMKLEDRVEQNAKMMSGESRDVNMRQHAAQWIAKNQATFDGWVAEAKKVR